jgi:hypothetical protein
MMTARTDKEARLKDFIAEGLVRRSDVLDGTDPVMIVMRNAESPVARALCVALSENPSEAIGVKVILGEILHDEPATMALLDMAGAEFRVLNDARFGAAHEQLVVGAAHVWIGDCLRRDPTKRDAFELYHRADPAIRVFAAASFGKLWAAAKPMKPTGTVAPEIIAAGQTDDPEAMPRSHRH